MSKCQLHLKHLKANLLIKYAKEIIFQNVRYNYIDSEDDEGVNVIEFEFLWQLSLAKRVM